MIGRVLSALLAALPGLYLAVTALFLGAWALWLGIVLGFALPVTLEILYQRNVNLLKSIAAGTVVGSCGLYVLNAILAFIVNDFWTSVYLVLLAALLAFCAASVGGLLASWSRNNAHWPFGLLGAIVFAASAGAVCWLVWWIDRITYREGPWIFYWRRFWLLAFWAANLWLGGWYTIRVVHKAAAPKRAPWPPGFEKHFPGVGKQPTSAGSEHVHPGLGIEGLQPPRASRLPGKDDSVE
jgi:hypothetical protein